MVDGASQLEKEKKRNGLLTVAVTVSSYYSHPPGFGGVLVLSENAVMSLSVIPGRKLQ